MNTDEIKVVLKSTALSNEFLSEIGRITVHFAILERDLIELTHKLLNLQGNIAKTITSELSFRGLQQLASSLLKEKFPEKSDAFKEILKGVGNAEERRNTISHSLWGMALLPATVERKVVRTKYSAKQKRGLHFSREELTTADLYAIAKEISIAAFDVERFNNSLGPESTT